MIKRLVFLITFTFGVIIVLAIGTSRFLPHQANAQGTQVQDCEQTCTWQRDGLLFKRVCVTEVPDFPRGRPPSCYRAEWDLDGDGIMEIRSETQAAQILSSSPEN